MIPSTVYKISPGAFHECENLREVRFCDKIETFVSKVSMREWWDYGRANSSLLTHEFLIRCEVPERFDMIRVDTWQHNICSMLKELPVLDSSSCYLSHDDRKKFQDHLEDIDSELAFYEACFGASSLLELALWKTKIDEMTDQDLSVNMQLQCRNNCGASVIIPLVLSFFLNHDEDE